MQNEINFQQQNKKFKKNFIKKSGDWFCPNCSNINFAFRSECNRCHLSKQKTMLMLQQNQMNDRIINNNNMNNNINNIQMNNIPDIPLNNNNPMNNNQILNQQMNQLIQNNLLNNQFNNNSNNNLNQNNNMNDNISQIQNLLYLLQTNNK